MTSPRRITVSGQMESGLQLDFTDEKGQPCTVKPDPETGELLLVCADVTLRMEKNLAAELGVRMSLWGRAGRLGVKPHAAVKEESCEP